MFVMFYFFFLQKAENNRLNKSQLAKVCNITIIITIIISFVAYSRVGRVRTPTN